VQGGKEANHIWAVPVEILRKYYAFQDNENPYFWLLFIGFVLRALTFLCLYGKSEYRSKIRFHVSNAIPTLKGLFSCQPCRERKKKSEPRVEHYSKQDDEEDEDTTNSF
jgi:hypothetical protein